jgi:hypothetical protein
MDHVDHEFVEVIRERGHGEGLEVMLSRSSDYSEIFTTESGSAKSLALSGHRGALC